MTTTGERLKIEEMKRVNFDLASKGWLEMQEARIEQKTLAGKTYREYKRNVATLARWFGKEGTNPKRLPAITPDDVKDFQDERRREVYRTHPDGTIILVGPHTINQECKVLNQMRSYVGMPFAKGAYKSLRKPKPKVGQALSDEERDRLLSTAKHMATANPKYWEAVYLFAKLAFNIGAGPKETCGIQLLDIHLNDEIPWVHIRGTKTEGRDRTLALNAEAQEAIILALDRAKRCSSTEPSHYLFPFFNQETRKHDATRPQTSFAHPWKTLREAAGLPTFRRYDMRHDFITRQLSDAEVSDEVVEEQVGHLTSAQKKWYSHQRLEKKQMAVDRMLRRKMKKYEKRPAQSVLAIDPELAQQIGNIFKGYLENMFGDMLKPR